MKHETRTIKHLACFMLHATCYILTASCFMFHASFAEAQLYVSPLKANITANAGETKQSTLRVTNTGSEDVTLTFQPKPFTVADKTGMVTVTETDTTGRSAASWFILPQQITIQAGKSENVPLTVTVPQDAAPGEHYAAIVEEPIITNPNSLPRNHMQVTTRIGSLYAIRVSGVATEAAFLTHLTYPFFAESGPITTSFLIENHGDYQISPQGTLTLTSLFHTTPTQSILPTYQIAPDKSRSYTLSVGNNSLIGKYNLRIFIGYGNHGRAIEKNVTLWIIPWKIITIIILFLTLLIIRILKA